MTSSGDAAEQIVRISLEGIDYAIRIVGAGAKSIAAFLAAAFKSDGTDGKIKLKGKERLVNMLKSGRDTKIFAIKNSDLKQFAAEAKRYGVTYCVLKDKQGSPDSMVEIMVTDADAGKIGRIMDRLEFAAVDLAALEAMPIERETLVRDDVDAALGSQPQNPTREGRTDGPPSEPRSGTQSESAKDTRGTKKPESVREFLRERTAQQRREDKQPTRAEPEAKATTRQRPNQHVQPQRTAKKKSKAKER
ncbi:MAG: PcfB family protein [Firmicutes bacterium]|nr:PcfB family protein [Bacillota bacterium]